MLVTSTTKECYFSHKWYCLHVPKLTTFCIYILLNQWSLASNTRVISGVTGVVDNVICPEVIVLCPIYFSSVSISMVGELILVTSFTNIPICRAHCLQAWQSVSCLLSTVFLGDNMTWDEIGKRLRYNRIWSINILLVVNDIRNS